MAGVAAARGRFKAAARVCAVRDTLLNSLSAALPPAHPDGYRRTLAKLDAALGFTAVAAARKSARSVPLDEVIATAR